MPDPDSDGTAPAEAVELYRLPLDEFTAARDQLAKQLKKDGDAAAAAAVKALRRPSNAAWALNQVATNEPGVVAAVLDAGAQLADASDAGDRAAIVAATKTERAARESAASAAMRMLDSVDHTPGGSGIRQQVLDTLHAAVVDDAVAAGLRAGTLDKAYASTGFFGGSAVVVRSKPSPQKAGPAKAAKPKLSLVKDGRDDRAAAKAKAKVEAEEAARKERLEQEARAKRAADAKKAAERADELEREADEAEARAAKARQLATDARTEATRLAD